MPDRRHPQVVNIDEAPAHEQSRGRFGFRARRLGAAVGSFALGCSQVELAPGKTAFPFHFHSSVDEALFVLEGSGTARIGGDEVALRAGDFVAFPAGPATAHALTNTGQFPLRYLALSAPATPVTLDVVGYPDSRKVAYRSGIDPARGSASAAWVKALHKEQPSVDYYLDEPLAKDE